MSDIAVRAHGLSKTYHLYDSPQDRLKQMLLGRWRKQPYYREVAALQSISFEVNRGETLGLVGRNGSGKSTLLQLIVGVLTPTAGEVSIQGRVAALLELGAGFNPEFSGRDNVFMNARLLGLTDAETRGRFDDIAEFAEIGAFMDEPVKTFSSGMFVRLAFAVAINVNPDILVVDEALSVGDEAFQRKCFARIRAFKEAGGTLLFVSHSSTAVIELCDRAICLDHGAALCAGAPRRVIEIYHKLIYAPLERAEEIKAKLRQDLGPALHQLPDEDRDAGQAGAERAAEAERQSLKAWLDPNLKPKSTTAYPEDGAAITDPRLETPDGERVNILVNRCEYVYVYRVHFTRDAEGVRFGMLIKTLSGFELGGAATSPADEGVAARAGETYEVRFRFRCNLAATAYFLNAGVSARRNGQERYLARLIDIAMFRVQAPANSLATCLVDFQIAPKAELVDRPP